MPKNSHFWPKLKFRHVFMCKFRVINLILRILDYKNATKKHKDEYFDVKIGDDCFYSINFEIPKNFYGNVELNLSISEHSITKYIDIQYPY